MQTHFNETSMESFSWKHFKGAEESLQDFRILEQGTFPARRKLDRRFADNRTRITKLERRARHTTRAM